MQSLLHANIISYTLSYWSVGAVSDVITRELLFASLIYYEVKYAVPFGNQFTEKYLFASKFLHIFQDTRVQLFVFLLRANNKVSYYLSSATMFYILRAHPQKI